MPEFLRFFLCCITSQPSRSPYQVDVDDTETRHEKNVKPTVIKPKSKVSKIKKFKNFFRFIKPVTSVCPASDDMIIKKELVQDYIQQVIAGAIKRIQEEEEKELDRKAEEFVHNTISEYFASIGNIDEKI